MTIPTLIALLAPIVGFVQWAKPVVAEPKVAPDIHSVEAFTAWLEKQPQGAEYDYTSTENCPIAKYLTAQGKTGVCVGPYYYFTDTDNHVETPQRLDDIAFGQPRTYAGMLSRAYRTQHRSVQP